MLKTVWGFFFEQMLQLCLRSVGFEQLQVISRDNNSSLLSSLVLLELIMKIE
jgi:hypothetical protein